MTDEELKRISCRAVVALKSATSEQLQVEILRLAMTLVTATVDTNVNTQLAIALGIVRHDLTTEKGRELDQHLVIH